MRTTLKQSLATLAALAALMLSGTACTQDDPLGGNNPAGTHLLQLGKVTIAGTTTATRSADAAGTRADIDADATTGFTGIRKHAFVAGDELKLTLTPPAGTGGSTPIAPITATLSADGTTWTLPQRTYFTAGTTIDARYTPATGKQPGGIRYSDDLVATNQDMETDGTPLALTLTHANAMVEVTPPASLITAGTTYTNLTISATPADPSGNGTSPQQPEALATAQEGTGNDLRHRTIAPAGATLHSISLTVNTVVYTAPISPEVKVAANKRYPITLKITAEEGLTATVAAGTNWDDGGDVNGYPTGYRYISTAADLQQLAAEVNADAAGTGARIATVLQTADIDMSGVAWEPIGTKNYPFSGSYNGNGYSIDKLTMSKTYTSGDTNYMGLFGFIADAKITGVHLRECTVTGSGGFQIDAGALIGHTDKSSIVTLCSATGSVTVTSAGYINAGGLVGYTYSSSTATPNHFTRCSANVDVTIKSTTRGSVGGFAGYTLGGYYAGCIASGKVHRKCASTNPSDGASSGFSHTYSTGYAYHAIGCITNSEVVNDNGVATSAFGQINTLRGCLATGTYGNLYVAAIDPVSNVHLNAMGSTPGTAPADAWGKLTESNHYSPINIKTLHYTADKGYTTDVVDLHRWYIYSIWKDNGGSLPTIDMSYEGNPMPITNKNKVYRVNGYWVTAPEANETKPYKWSATAAEIAMNPNPCTGTWSMPTMEDFEALLGWTGTHGWQQGVTTGNYYSVADADNFAKAFTPNYTYWSATPNTKETANAWRIIIGSTGKTAAYGFSNKTTNDNCIRCVQKIAP